VGSLWTRVGFVLGSVGRVKRVRSVRVMHPMSTGRDGYSGCVGSGLWGAWAVVGLGWLLGAAAGCSSSSNLDSAGSGQAVGGLVAPPVANRFVGTQHPSALGPLWYQANTGEPMLDRIVVTPADQLAQAKIIFDTGPSSYMIDYEGKVNDIAVIAQLVEYATPGLHLHDEVFDRVHADLFTKVEQLKTQQPDAFGDFPITRSWDAVATQRAENGYLLGWWHTLGGGVDRRADENLRREIYVRLPEPTGKGGFDRASVIREIARINYRYILHQYATYRVRNPRATTMRVRCGENESDAQLATQGSSGSARGEGPALELRNAIVRLIDPQTKITHQPATGGFADSVQEINLGYDAAFAQVVRDYDGTEYEADPPLKQLLFRAGQPAIPSLPVQAVALVEEPETVIFGADWLRFYLNEFYKPRYGALPPSVILFMAGSDLNRITGPIPGEYLRSILINRLHGLQREFADVHIIPWIGSGGNAVRSGPGMLVRSSAGNYFKEQDGPNGAHSLLNLGIARTFQPDHLEAVRRMDGSASAPFTKQPAAEEVALVYDASRSLTGTSIPSEFGQEEENRRIVWTGILLFTHIDRINRYALPLSNLRALLERHNQVGRVKSAAPTNPTEAAYGRDWPQVYGYLNEVLKNAEQGFAPSQWRSGNGQNLRTALSMLLETLQERLQANKSWTSTTKSTRAINDAFGRYILGTPLTTVHGIGATLRLLAKIPATEYTYFYTDPNTGDDNTQDLLNAWGKLPSQLRPIDQFVASIRREIGIGNVVRVENPMAAIYDRVPEEVQRLWLYYVRNDGFAVIRSESGLDGISDRDLIAKRIDVAFPADHPEVQNTVETLKTTVPALNVTDYTSFKQYLVQEYMNDVAALEDFLRYKNGDVPCSLYEACSGVDVEHAQAYRRKLNALLIDEQFKKAMRGEALETDRWYALFREKIVPLLAIPGWNRVG
jgi:hypothetical protein